MPSLLFHQTLRYGGFVSTTPDTIPIEGNARVEGQAGGITISWVTFGSVTDAHVGAVDAPKNILLTDKGQVRTTAWTLTQVADGLAEKGQSFSFHADHRPGHPDELSMAIVDAAEMVERERFVQLRCKVGGEGVTNGSSAPGLPEVSILDIASDFPAWMDLYASTLDGKPQRGITTVAGVRRQVEEASMARPLFLGARDPEDPQSLVGAVVATAVASGEGAPPVGELFVLAVREPWRRRGLGKALMAAALGHLADAGVRTAIAYVDSGNDEALAFFKGAGFNERGARVYYERPSK